MLSWRSRSVLLVGFLLSPVALAAPPIAPKDARGSFAVYCAVTCDAFDLPGFTVAEKLPDSAGSPTYEMALYGTDFGMPDAATLAVWGTGNVAGAAGAQEVLVVTWAGPRGGAAARVAEVGRALTRAGTWFEDLDTGRFFDAPELEAALQAYSSATPDATALITIEMGEHADGEPTRLVTRGLRKVGLPELAMPNVTSDQEEAMITALNATAQAVFEQGLQGSVPVVASAMKAKSVAADSCEIDGNATLTSTKRKSSDPQGPIAEVVFDGEVGTCEPPVLATQPPADIEATQGMVMLWVDDPVADVPEPDSLVSARAKALQRLSGPVKEAWQKGFGEGDQLLVKAPFRAVDGSTEWLWMRVDRWDADDQLTGRLVSEPTKVTTLSKGALVVAGRSQLFDYLWYKADGTQEGNTTQTYL